MAAKDSSEDVVTELQTCLDQMATQFYASLRYITTHHPLSAPSALANAVINPQSLPNPGAASGSNTAPGSPSAAQPAAEAPPASPSHKPMESDAFEADQRELAVDLVALQRQIEELVRQLPEDIDEEEDRQEKRIAELEEELRGMEDEVRDVGERRERALELVEQRIGCFRKV